MASKFSVVKKGYDPAEVEDYISTMESVIKGYKEKDASIKNAILNAQIAADSIVQNAKNQAKEIKQSALDQVEDIKISISAQKNMLKDFQDDYNRMINKYLHSVNNNDIGAVKNKIDSLEGYLDRFSGNKDTPEERPIERFASVDLSVTNEEKQALIG